MQPNDTQLDEADALVDKDEAQPEDMPEGIQLDINEVLRNMQSQFFSDYGRVLLRDAQIAAANTELNRRLQEKQSEVEAYQEALSAAYNELDHIKRVLGPDRMFEVERASVP